MSFQVEDLLIEVIQQAEGNMGILTGAVVDVKPLYVLGSLAFFMPGSQQPLISIQEEQMFKDPYLPAGQCYLHR